LDFGTSPERFNNHLGSGPAGRSVVYMATYRERKVAVKVMATPFGKDSPLNPPLDGPVHCPSGLDRGDSSSLSTGYVSEESRPMTFSRREAVNVRSFRSRNRQFLQEVRRTVRNWSRLPHMHLTLCHGICLQEDKVMIVMEFMAYGSLCDMLRNSTIDISEEMAIEFLTDITKGMMCLHSSKPQPTLHRCLSSTHVLLDGNLNAKLSDVGFPRLDAGLMAHLQAAMRERTVDGRTGTNSQKSAIMAGYILQYSSNIKALTPESFCQPVQRCRWTTPGCCRPWSTCRPRC
jgi:serine/threonine protein kinase